MTTREKNILKVMLKVQTFEKKHSNDFQPNGNAIKCFAKNDQLIQQAQDLGLIQNTSGTQAHGGTVGKEAHELHLRALIRPLVNTGRRAFRAQPTLESQFRNPPHGTTQELEDDVKALRQLAATHKQVFLDNEMPADFLEEIDEALNAWKNSGEAQNAGDQEHSGATDAVGPLLREALANIRDLDVPVRNRYRDNAQATGEWETASHVDVESRSKNAADATSNNTPQS